jgi:hypothetical protein
MLMSLSIDSLQQQSAPSLAIERSIEPEPLREPDRSKLSRGLPQSRTALPRRKAIDRPVDFDSPTMLDGESANLGKDVPISSPVLVDRGPSKSELKRVAKVSAVAEQKQAKESVASPRKVNKPASAVTSLVSPVSSSTSVISPPSASPSNNSWGLVDSAGDVSELHSADGKEEGEAEEEEEEHKNEEAQGHLSDGTPYDWTSLPGALDAKLLALDPSAALRPTTLKCAEHWTLRSQKSLLAAPTTRALDAEEQDRGRRVAFDLLDALSRSGSLAIDCAELHVVLAFTHQFDRTLMDTVVQGNVNPIEKVERSSLLVASALHGQPPRQLVKHEQLPRLERYVRTLFLEREADAVAEIAANQDKCRGSKAMGQYL